MKKIIVSLLMMLAVAVATVNINAQTVTTPLPDEPNLIIPQRETIVVDNFTSVPNITLGMFQYIRDQFMNAINRKGRLDVIDVEEYGVGRPQSVFPPVSYHKNIVPSHPYDISRRENILSQFDQARYYLTVYVSAYSLTSEVKDQKETFRSRIELTLYAYDSEKQQDIPSRIIIFTNTGSTAENAESSVLYNMNMYVQNYIEANFRYKASLIQLSKFNKRGKLEELYLSCGENIGVRDGDVFFLFAVTNMSGIESGKKIGKVRVREITGANSCRCTVARGEEEIADAFRNGATIVAISYTDSYF